VKLLPADPITAFGPQPPQPSETLSPLAKLGFASAGIMASGFIPYGGGRLWDVYLQGIRTAETAFPAAILRTFRISEFLSPLETWSRIDLPEAQLKAAGQYGGYLRNIFGTGGGLTMERTGAIFGDVTRESKAIGMGLQITAGTQKGSAIADYYARLSKTKLGEYQSLNEALLRSEYEMLDLPIDYKEWLDEMAPSERRRKLILGAKFREKIRIFGKDIQLSEKMQRRVAKGEILGKLMRAKAATTAGRLNMLLSKPFEVFPILNRIPVVSSMKVQPGSAMQMAGRYMMKGLGLAAAYKGLEYYDYLRAEGSAWAPALGTAGGAAAGAFLFKRPGQMFRPAGLAIGAATGLYTALAPRFDEGLFYGVASMFTDLNLARARASEALGLSESLREQEAVTPGLVSLKTAVGFGGVGMLAGGLAGYGGLLGAAVRQRHAAGPERAFADITEDLRKEHVDKIADAVWESKLGKAVKKLPGGRLLAKARHPMALGFLGGVAAWGALSTGMGLLSGNLMAAIPGLNLLGTTETSEELEAIYSGEKEVPIRKGRWWEFGRCLANSSMIPMCYAGTFKEAHEVRIGDVLIGRDGEEAKVVNIFTRKFSGNIIKFKTRASWITETKLTGNHKVPVLRGEEIVEVEAKGLRVNDRVEIPIPQLKETSTELISEDLIKTGLFLICEDILLPAQKNWYSGKVQRSRGASIPRVVTLTPELGRLFGYFLAEGNISYKNDIPHMIETVHAKSERWIVDDVVSISEKEFGITPTVRFKKGKKKTNEGCWVVRICSSLLARMFFELFYNSERQQDKIFPQVFMSAPKAFKEQLVEGYRRGDGHLDQRTCVISSCRRGLLDAIFSILLNLGEYPYLCKFEKNDYRGRHRIKWTPGRIPYFYKVCNSKLYSVICAIETEDYDDIVYDFEVDHPDHLFQAGTFLVHNSTPYEGGRIEYYRPHFMERLRTRAFQKGMYGTEEEKWEHDPWLHPLKALFGSDEWKYHYERKYQYERPAPLAGTYGKDVPFFGPLVAATVGKALKPRKLIRPEEWMLDEGEYVHRPDVRKETEPAYELGGLRPGAPVVPEEGSQLFNELMYRRREAVGLVGFAEGAIEHAMTGREEFFQNLQTLGVMGKETGSEYWLWSHLNVGGALGACLPAGEKVFTPDGLKNIEDIQVGDAVYDHRMKTKQVLNVFERICGSDEQMITINTRVGNKTVRVTGNHPVAVYKRIPCRDSHARPCTPHSPKKHCSVCGLCDTEIAWQWVRADAIEPNDFVVMPLPGGITSEDISIDFGPYAASTATVTDDYIYSRATKHFAKAIEALENNPLMSRKDLREIVPDQYAKEALNSYRKKHSPKRTPRKVVFGRDLAWFVGWWIAEGSADPQAGDITFTLALEELDIAHILGEIYTARFGFSYNISTKPEQGSCALRLHNIPLARWLKQFGTDAGTKKLAWLIDLPISLLPKLIAGLIGGDGWSNKEKYSGGFTSKSNRLVRDLWIVLARLGVFATVTDDYLEIPKPNNQYPQGEQRKPTLRSYLKFSKDQHDRYCRIILDNDWEESFEHSNGRQFTQDGFLYYSVRNVKAEPATGVKVFDIEVEESHCFVGDYLLLHNSEPVRRFIPRTRSYLETYNPLKNTMPSWMPEDYFLDLKYGNPFQKIKEAEIRLPGPGYEALHPEVAGVHPEEYPLVHRLKILGDVAMWSDEYKWTLQKAKRNFGRLSDQDKQLVRTVEEQVKSRKQRRKITEYRFRPELLGTRDITVTEVLDPRRIKAAEFGDMVIELQGVGAITNMQKAMDFATEHFEGQKITIKAPQMESRRYDVTKRGSRMKAVAMMGDQDYGQVLAEQKYAEAKELRDEFEQLRFTPAERLAGRMSETILHGIETPMEYLTPMSPASKLIRQRSAIEEYIASEAIGTQAAFWNRPVENFLQPAADMALHAIGFNRIPEQIRQRRDINEYFDMLDWVKAERAERIARHNNRWSDVREEQELQQRTMFGLDVFGSPVAAMRALPRRERDFFAAFTGARSPEEREEILSLIPENEQRLYMSKWLQQEAGAARAKEQAGIATKEDEQTLITTALMRKTEGFGATPEMEEQWRAETDGKIPFDEWIRELKAKEYFKTHSLPGADWLGWCVPPKQDILTSDGRILHASDVKLDQSLTTLQGENQVKQVFERQTNEDIIIVKTHHNSVYCMAATENHIVLGIQTERCKYNLKPESVCTHATTMWKCNFCTTKHYESYSAKWMPIGKLTTNTYLPIPLLKHTDEDPVIDIGKLNCFPNNTLILDDTLRPKTGRIKPINRFIKLDEATCWLIGYYLAGGNTWAVGDRMRGVQFTAHIDEVPILELAQKIIKDKFGLDSIIRFKKKPKSESAYLVVANSIFGWLINHWVGRYCDQKYSPSWLENITQKSQAALLDGLNTGDASKDERGRLILANRQLCYMAKRLYEAQGIPASLHGPKKRNGKAQYAVESLSSSLSAIVGENFIAYRVETIERSQYEGTVLDFEVEDQHMYCSPIGIYHNSPSVDMEDVKLQYVQMAGLDHHEFDLWGARKRALARKPYINEDLIRDMQARAELEDVMIHKLNAETLAKVHGGSGSRVMRCGLATKGPDEYDIEIVDSRDELVRETHKRMGVR
jgi:intein/homing endonuclease